MQRYVVFDRQHPTPKRNTRYTIEQERDVVYATNSFDRMWIHLQELVRTARKPVEVSFRLGR